MRVILHCLVGASLVLVAGCVSDRTRGGSEVCEVHHSRMSKVTLPIEFGLFHPPERERARDVASMNEFPHALTRYYDGCGPSSLTAPRQVRIYECAECQRARQQWEAEYDKTH